MFSGARCQSKYKSFENLGLRAIKKPPPYPERSRRVGGKYFTAVRYTKKTLSRASRNPRKMLGNYQQSQIRIEVDASFSAIRDSLLRPQELEKWVPTGRFATGMPEELHSGFEFTTQTGPLSIHHQVDVARPNCLRLLLSQGIDGFHEWYWGEGWVQSRLEGVTILPLSLGQTLSLLSLRQFLVTKKR